MFPTLHDEAFDKGLMAINPDLEIAISPHLSKYHNEAVQRYFGDFSQRRFHCPFGSIQIKNIRRGISKNCS